MKQVIDLLGKTVKFVHTENGHFFEEQGKVTEVLLSLNFLSCLHGSEL